MPCEDGLRVACPSPLLPLELYEGCRQEGVTDCNTLAETACRSVIEECHDDGRCSTNCHCELGPDGVTLTWKCATLLCD